MSRERVIAWRSHLDCERTAAVQNASVTSRQCVLFEELHGERGRLVRVRVRAGGMNVTTSRRLRRFLTGKECSRRCSVRRAPGGRPRGNAVRRIGLAGRSERRCATFGSCNLNHERTGMKERSARFFSARACEIRCVPFRVSSWFQSISTTARAHALVDRLPPAG